MWTLQLGGRPTVAYNLLSRLRAGLGPREMQRRRGPRASRRRLGAVRRPATRQRNCFRLCTSSRSWTLDPGDRGALSDGRQSFRGTPASDPGCRAVSTSSLRAFDERLDLSRATTPPAHVDALRKATRPPQSNGAVFYRRSPTFSRGCGPLGVDILNERGRMVEKPFLRDLASPASSLHAATVFLKSDLPDRPLPLQ